MLIFAIIFTGSTLFQNNRLISAQDNNIFLHENIEQNCVENKYFDVFFIKCSKCDPKLDLEPADDCEFNHITN